MREIMPAWGKGAAATPPSSSSLPGDGAPISHRAPAHGVAGREDSGGDRGWGARWVAGGARGVRQDRRGCSCAAASSSSRISWWLALQHLSILYHGTNPPQMVEQGLVSLCYLVVLESPWSVYLQHVALGPKKLGGRDIGGEISIVEI